MYVLNKFVSARIQKSTSLHIHIVSKNDVEDSDEQHDLRTHYAWCEYKKYKNGRRNIEIVINANQIKAYQNTFFTKYREFLICLSHELVHAKQYLTGELKDYANGSSRFNGELCGIIEPQNKLEEMVGYHDYPYEIEAYGREMGLVKTFMLMKRLEKFENTEEKDE